MSDTTSEAKSIQIIFRARPDLRDWLADRAARAQKGGGTHARARVELEMWRAAMRVEAARTVWTPAEVAALAHIQGDAPLDGVTSLAARARDELRPDPILGAPAGYGIDTGQLLAKLDGLSPVADHATMDAISRWWADDDRQHTVEGWAAVGLTVAADKADH